MKKIMILIAAFTLSLSSMVIAQDDMMGNRGNSNGNSSFSTTEILLGIIVVGLIVGGLVWFFNNKRNVNNQK